MKMFERKDGTMIYAENEIELKSLENWRADIKIHHICSCVSLVTFLLCVTVLALRII